MKMAKRIAAALLALMLALPAVALAQIDGRSDPGAFAVEMGDKVYVVLNEHTLYLSLIHI